MKALTKDRAGRSLSKQPHRDRAVKRFIESVDYPRLEQILASDERYRPLLALMKDPLMFARGKGRMSFAAVLYKSDIPLTELHQVYVEGSRQLCMLEMANNLPAIGRSVSKNAINRDEACPSCQGEGSLPLNQLDGATDGELDGMKCKVCNGSGKIVVMGDKHAIDTVGKWMHMEPKAGLTINNLLSQNANFGGGNDRIEDLLSKTAQVINVEASEVTEDAV